ncbi:uncharacterized protein LOC127869935 [Dreissena polymorpha]|uniref:uncharacterized protein LOC127869935 n=1 Tax=Dreissena polymorpha TaxID=45954 RepID=UPI002264961F|nr:uncharacterized protein LOC127869935 [Dreissena polymorpha]
MTEAETVCIRTCQMTSYPEEIQRLTDNKKVSPPVKQLKLFMKDNVVRCGGRIHNAALEEEAKLPILLSAKHAFTHHVVKDAHERLHHAGPSSTITLLRGKYLIPAIRPCVRSVLRKCETCREVSGRPYKAPDPPPLPKTRLSDVATFTYTGVDYSGALSVRDNNGNDIKRYICLFTCASTIAVHLELVPDLSAESFLFAFRRFCSRKST